MKTNLLAGHCLIKTMLLPLVVFFMTSSAFAQNKIYASSQNHQIKQLCLLCAVQNPQNAVGSNENDYSTLKIGIGVTGSIEQTLSFSNSTSSKIEKVTIGIGTNNNKALSVQQLKGITVQTIHPSIKGNTRVIDSKILKTDIQDSTRGVIEIETAGPLLGIKITLNSGLVNLDGGLRIYYAYYSHVQSFSYCSPLYNPIAKYSFNGNIHDEISGFNMTSTIPPVYQTKILCGQGLTYPETLKVPSLLSSDYTEATIAFWAKSDTIIHFPQADVAKGFVIYTFPCRIYVEPSKITLGIFGGPPTSYRSIPITPNTLHHYVIVFKGKEMQLFIDGQQPINIKNTFYYQDLSLPIQIDMISGQLDEFLVYSYALNQLEAQNLYDLSQKLHSNIIAESHLSEKTFTVSPNPTSGNITLDGNISMIDSEVSIRNASGTQVYHTKFTSKTFDLPPNLPGGVYILSVQTKDKKVYTRKIILTR